MRTRTFCQCVLVCLLLLIFLRGLWKAFHGVPAHEPYGFRGALVTIVATVLFALAMFGAGAFGGDWE